MAPASSICPRMGMKSGIKSMGLNAYNAETPIAANLIFKLLILNAILKAATQIKTQTASTAMQVTRTSALSGKRFTIINIHFFARSLSPPKPGNGINHENIAKRQNTLKFRGRERLINHCYPSNPNTLCGKAFACANMLVALCTMI